MENLKNELLLLWGKIWIWAALIFLGIIGKLSYDIKMKRKLSFLSIAASIGIGVFMGYLASAWCIYMGWQQQGMFLVPMATIASEKGIEAVISNGHRWFSPFYKKPKDDEDSN